MARGYPASTLGYPSVLSGQDASHHLPTTLGAESELSFNRSAALVEAHMIHGSSIDHRRQE